MTSVADQNLLDKILKLKQEKYSVKDILDELNITSYKYKKLIALNKQQKVNEPSKQLDKELVKQEEKSDKQKRTRKSKSNFINDQIKESLTENNESQDNQLPTETPKLEKTKQVKQRKSKSKKIDDVVKEDINELNKFMTENTKLMNEHLEK